MAGPSFEASAPYFERYIEQETKNLIEVTRFFSSFAKTLKGMYPEILL